MAPKRKTAPKPEPFLRRVEEALLRVPAGRVVTYGQLALLAGRPRAARAVGMLMAQNPYGELLPCHRVIAASGRLSSRSFRVEQARRLREEGVEVSADYRVDLSRYGWDGVSEEKEGEAGCE